MYTDIFFQIYYSLLSFLLFLNTGDELADMDFKELKRLRVEGEGWIRTAELLRLEVVGEDFVIEQKPPETGKEVKKESHDFLDVSAATSTEVRPTYVAPNCSSFSGATDLTKGFRAHHDRLVPVFASWCYNHF